MVHPLTKSNLTTLTKTVRWKIAQINGMSNTINRDLTSNGTGAIDRSYRVAIPLYVGGFVGPTRYMTLALKLKLKTRELNE